MKVGNTLQLSPQISDSDTDKKLTYINLTSNIISVSGSGLVTAKNIGTGKIIVREENSGAQIEYTINVVDSEPPVISVSPLSSDWVKNINVRINVTDNKNELNNNNIYQYQLSTSNSTPTGTWQNYKNGTAFTIGSGLTGNYYLWVKQVYDIDDNISQQGGTKVGNYHVFGPYKFDNSVPTFTMTAKLGSTSGSTYQSGNWTNQSVYITLSGSDTTGINKYEWKEGENGSWSTTSLTTSNNVGTIVFDGDRNSTIYFRATDKLGNVSSESSIIIRKETTAPEVTISTNGGTVKSEAKVNAKGTITSKVTATDSGGSSLKSLQYAITTATSAPSTGWTTTDSGATISKSGLSAETYYLYARATDNAGNVTTSKSNAFTVITVKQGTGADAADWFTLARPVYGEGLQYLFDVIVNWTNGTKTYYVKNITSSDYDSNVKNNWNLSTDGAVFSLEFGGWKWDVSQWRPEIITQISSTINSYASTDSKGTVQCTIQNFEAYRLAGKTGSSYRIMCYQPWGTYHKHSSNAFSYVNGQSSAAWYRWRTHDEIIANYKSVFVRTLKNLADRMNSPGTSTDGVSYKTIYDKWNAKI